MDLYEVLAEVRAWQRVQFPESTPESSTAHLVREARELAERPHEPSEYADVLMLLWCAADLAGIDLAEATAQKLQVNRARRWGEVNADGFREHVREGDDGNP